MAGMRVRDVVDMLLLAAIWGGGFMLMRAAAPSLGPWSMAFLRVLLGAAFLAAVMPWHGGLAAALRGIGGKGLPSLVLGVFNSAMPFVMFGYAFGVLTTGFGTLINATSPLFAALVARVWMGERLSRQAVLGIAIGFAGVVLLVWGKPLFREGGDGLRVAAALMGAVGFAFGANFPRRYLREVPSIQVALGSQIGATLALAPFVAIDWPQEPLSLNVWLAVLGMGLVSTGWAYLLYFRLIARIGAVKSVTILFMVPVFGMGFGALLLDEAITLQMLAGGAVILMGTALVTGLARLPGAAKA